MTKRLTLWICLVDGAHARIIEPAASGIGYSLVRAFDSADAHHATHDLGTERPPRTQESGYSGRHAIEPRSDLHRAEKIAFLDSFAAILAESDKQGAFDQLMLFAPAAALHELREALGPEIRGKIVLEAAKDLVKLPLHELPAHIEAARAEG